MLRSMRKVVHEGDMAMLFTCGCLHKWFAAGKEGEDAILGHFRRFEGVKTSIWLPRPTLA